MATRSKAAGEPRSCQVVVLAAGEGTRMRSSLPKVLHRVAGRPLVAHVLAAATGSGAGRVAVVVGPGADATARLVTSLVPGAAVFEQTERKGTAHAVLAARAALSPADEDVLVLYGDTPLLRPATLMRLREALAAGADLAVAGFRTDSPEGYGRLIMDGGRLVAIREQRDATPAEQAIRFCNGGLMAFRGERILSLLDRIGNANSKREFYLTDAVSIATSDGLAVAAVETDAEDVIGVNTQAELAEAERLWQARARQAALDRGTTLVAPDTVHFAYDTEVAPEAVIEPYVVFGPGAVVEGGATVRAFSHVEGARIAAGATIGPYARLRPGAEIGAKARIGNFVEVKNASVAAGAKVNHLSYIGDASIGEKANIGAGTITCNYDGVRKHRTTIGAGAFIGSNSALVAPVSIGDGAYVGSGSVISRDVPADALAIARGQQVVKPGWAARFRAMFQGGGQAD